MHEAEAAFHHMRLKSRKLFQSKEGSADSHRAKINFFEKISKDLTSKVDFSL